MADNGLSKPLADGTISLGLYAHDGDARTRADLVVREGVLAERAGFDGLTVSEHHLGFSGYFPLPELVASWLLERTSRTWVAAMPLVANLRPLPILIEHLAWLAARNPGRVGLGLAPGYSVEDFDLFDVPFERRVEDFTAALNRVSSVLSGDSDSDPLFADPAVAALSLRGHQVPVVAAAGSKTAARRAAKFDMGMVFGSHSDTAEMKMLVDEYREHGGTGSVVAARRIWLGNEAAELFARQAAKYQSLAGGGIPWSASGHARQLLSGDADFVIKEIVESVQASGVTALNLRVHVQGLPPEAIGEQIAAVGVDVVGALRKELGW